MSTLEQVDEPQLQEAEEAPWTADDQAMSMWLLQRAEKDADAADAGVRSIQAKQQYLGQLAAVLLGLFANALVQARLLHPAHAIGLLPAALAAASWLIVVALAVMGSGPVAPQNLGAPNEWLSTLYGSSANATLVALLTRYEANYQAGATRHKPRGKWLLVGQWLLLAGLVAAAWSLALVLQ